MRNEFRRSTSGRRSGQRFDAEHGVVTEALVFLGELDPDAIGAAIEDATHYEPTPVAEFRALLGALPERAEGWTFVDIGAGLGRVVMLASLRKFRQVIGVEVSASLCETARDNLVRWRRTYPELACKDVRIVCADAGSFRFPKGDLIVYLYNPFGERTLAQMAARLTQHDGGACYILYHTPVQRAVFDEDPRFESVADLGFGAIYRVRELA
jgi:SAM-dependent methyltransferase